MSQVRAGSLFELRQLRCFVAAAEELHFGRAAARVNMTQPPLSRQIQLLERVLGVKLLDRTSRVVNLTPAGRVFLLEARRILRLTESAALTTRRTASGEAGTITLPLTRHLRLQPPAATGQHLRFAAAQCEHGAEGDGEQRTDRSASDGTDRCGIASPADRPDGIHQDPHYHRTAGGGVAPLATRGCRKPR